MLRGQVESESDGAKMDPLSGLLIRHFHFRPDPTPGKPGATSDVSVLKQTLVSAPARDTPELDAGMMKH
jgi:hypothetical protein